jgi:hypothetical protein
MIVLKLRTLGASSWCFSATFSYIIATSFSGGGSQYFSYIIATSFNGGGSQSTRRESPTMGKQLVNFNKILKIRMK